MLWRGGASFRAGHLPFERYFMFRSPAKSHSAVLTLFAFPPVSYSARSMLGQLLLGPEQDCGAHQSKALSSVRTFPIMASSCLFFPLFPA